MTTKDQRTTSKVLSEQINEASQDRLTLIMLDKKLDKFYDAGLLTSHQLANLDGMIMMRLALLNIAEDES